MKDVKLQKQQKYEFNNESSSYKKITQHRKKSPVEYKESEIIGTRPATSRNVSPIGRTTEFAQIQRLRDGETGHTFLSCSAYSSTDDYSEKYDTLYHQPQSPADYNQRQHYLNHRTTQ